MQETLTSTQSPAKKEEDSFAFTIDEDLDDDEDLIFKEDEIKYEPDNNMVA